METGQLKLLVGFSFFLHKRIVNYLMFQFFTFQSALVENEALNIHVLKTLLKLYCTNRVIIIACWEVKYVSVILDKSTLH